MRKSKDVTIPSSIIRIGSLSKDAVFSRASGLAPSFLTPDEINQMPYIEFFAKDVVHRGIVFMIDEDRMGVDLFNDDVLSNYPVMNFTPKFLKRQIDNNGFAIGKSFSLEPVLKYLGFPHEMTSKDFYRLRKFLTNKRRIRNLSEPCSYLRIDTSRTSVLDYDQEVKLSRGEYYKFVDNQTIRNEKCEFYSDGAIDNPVIQPASIFKILVDNLNSGYEPINGEIMAKSLRR